jgi:hypothetical protein
MRERSKGFWEGLAALRAVVWVSLRQPATATDLAHAPTFASVEEDVIAC